MVELLESLGLAESKTQGDFFTDFGNDPQSLEFLELIDPAELEPEAPREPISDKEQKKNAFAFNAPIPGQSLTTSPKSMPYERPPQFTEEGPAMDWLFQRFSQEEIYVNTMRLLDAGIPIQLVAESLLTSGAASGKWNVDLALLIAEPLMTMLATMAINAGINPTIQTPRKKKAINGEAIKKALQEQQKENATNTDTEQEETVEENVKSLLDIEPGSK